MSSRHRVLLALSTVLAGLLACNALLGVDRFRLCDDAECTDAATSDAGDSGPLGDADAAVTPPGDADAGDGCVIGPDLFDAAPACSPDASWVGATAMPLGINIGPGESSGGALSPDGREFYFSERDFNANWGVGDGYRIFVAPATADGGFGTPTFVTELNMTFDGGIPSGDSHPEESPDGLTMYFDSYRFGGGPFVSTRASRCDPWGPPVPLTALGSGYRAYPVPGFIYYAAPWTSDAGTDPESIFRAAGSGTAVGFGQLVPELSSTSKDFDPVVTPDELHVYLASDRNGFYAFQIFYSDRASTSDPWNPIQKMPDNVSPSTAANLPSYVTPDNCTLYFVSSPNPYNTTYTLYRVTRGK